MNIIQYLKKKKTNPEAINDFELECTFALWYFIYVSHFVLILFIIGLHSSEV